MHCQRNSGILSISGLETKPTTIGHVQIMLHTVLLGQKKVDEGNSHNIIYHGLIYYFIPT